MEANESKTKILLLPWLAHGHVSPFLELAKRLTHRDIHCYICSTPVILDSIEPRVTPKFADSIELVPFHIPPSPELPLHCHTTNGLPPRLMVTLKDAYENSSSQFSSILSNIQPDVVIYDFNQYWAAEMAASLSIPAVKFVTGSVAFLSVASLLTQNPGGKFPFPEIYLRDYEMRKLQAYAGSEVNQRKELDRMLRAQKNSGNILLVNSSMEIEGKYIDFLSGILGKKVVPVGQLVPDDYPDETENQSEIIQWLDKQGKSSVIFVAFGSEYFLTREERYAIAKGLELSEVSFIWVIRFPLGDRIAIEESLPEGFLGRTKNRGLVVEGWAPQGRILRHRNTGGFLSHCGWSSVMEAMKFGVPIVAMPMQIDQPFNARLVEAIGVGVEAIRDEEGMLQSEEIGKVIRKIMVEESGEDVRKKVKEWSLKLQMKGDEETDALVQEIKELS